MPEDDRVCVKRGRILGYSRILAGKQWARYLPSPFVPANIEFPNDAAWYRVSPSSSAGSAAENLISKITTPAGRENMTRQRDE